MTGQNSAAMLRGRSMMKAHPVQGQRTARNASSSALLLPSRARPKRHTKLKAARQRQAKYSKATPARPDYRGTDTGGGGGMGNGRNVPKLGGEPDPSDGNNNNNFESLVYTVGSVALASAVCLFALPEESFAAAAAPTAAEHTRGEAGVGVPACLQKALSKIKMNINVNERQGAQKLEVGPVSASPSTATSTTATSSSSSSVFRSVSKKKKVPKGTGSLILGQGSSVAGIAFAYKTLLCWCAEDVELASTATDLGYLSFVGCFSMFTVREHYKVARVFMIQAALSHILLEMVFELGVMRFLDPKAKTHRMSWDMIFHHIGSLATGLYCVKAGGGSFCNGPFLKQGARLACTEITTGFPVAFKAALKNKKFKGKRRVFFAAGMPLAFMWRSWYTLDVLKSFLKTVDELGGRKAVPSKWVGAGCFGSIVFCNMYWTLRIFSGVLKTIRGKKKGKKKDAEQGEKS